MDSIFSGIIGHEAEKEYLLKISASKSVAHAYCFSGAEFLGKSLIVERFVSHLLGIDSEKLKQHPDFVLVERQINEKTGEYKTSIGVDELRRLKTHFSMSSLSGGKKVAIIQHADSMTVAAQNALLKTLEEPAGDSLIILIARNPESLLATILSRVVHLKFSLVEREIICEFLRKDMNRELAHATAGIAGGRPGVAQRMLESGERDVYKEKVDEAIDFLGAPLAERFKLVEKVSKADSKLEIEKSIAIWRGLLHDCLLMSMGCEHLLSHSDSENEINRLVKQRKDANWGKVLEALGESEISLRHNGNVTLALEHFVLAF